MSGIHMQNCSCPVHIKVLLKDLAVKSRSLYKISLFSLPLPPGRVIRQESHFQEIKCLLQRRRGDVEAPPTILVIECQLNAAILTEDGDC